MLEQSSQGLHYNKNCNRLSTLSQGGLFLPQLLCVEFSDLSVHDRKTCQSVLSRQLRGADHGGHDGFGHRNKVINVGKMATVAQGNCCS